MSNKQSSVEWVIENLTLIHALLVRKEIGVEFFNRKYNEIVEQGKVMHKEEQKIAYNAKLNNWYFDFEHYYNETFGGNSE